MVSISNCIYIYVCGCVADIFSFFHFFNFSIFHFSIFAGKGKLYVAFAALQSNARSFLEQEARQTKRSGWRSDNTNTRLLDDVVMLSERFHKLTSMTKLSVVEDHYKRLKNMKLDLMPLEEIVALGNKGFVQCSCEEYKHYGHCQHACGTAIKRNIITSLHNLGQRNPSLMRARGVRTHGNDGPAMDASKSLSMQVLGSGFRDIQKSDRKR